MNHKFTCWEWTWNDYTCIFRCGGMVEYIVLSSSSSSKYMASKRIKKDATVEIGLNENLFKKCLFF